MQYVRSPTVLPFGEDPETKWHTEGSVLGIFSSVHEVLEAFMRAGGSRRTPTSLLFEYGIRYDENVDMEHACRTVVIKGIPSKFTITQLLSEIRGGQIFSATLMNTTAMLGLESAMVTFVTAQGAKSFVNMLARGDCGLLSLMGLNARVLGSPTFPMSEDLVARITRGKLTRCLRVERSKVKKAVRKLNKSAKCNIEFTCVDRGSESYLGPECVLEFPSVKMADWAHYVLTEDPVFEFSEVRFFPDPCDA
ncbi:hypothetical protein N7493_003358 [Penicillium malachiteum]|uniref:Uncharacterized protein n=1 Tax=Penicillium malachiteum TaxID=1324776 RepID=A0AAD6HQ22_9EURO|nr:hypothetical protein N7493_003358 [Penicillium malachiteum]